MTRAKRGFASINRMRSGRYQVRYTAPSGARVTAGRTFTTKVAAEAWAADRRRQIDRGHPEEDRPKPVTFAAYAATWIENRHVAGRPIKARTRGPLHRDPRPVPAARVRQPAAGRDPAPGCARLARGHPG